MKCIKWKDGTVERLSDWQALVAVSKGAATYVPKSEWKKKGKKA